LLIGIGLVDFVLSGNQIDGHVDDLSLELSIFGVQLVDSLLEVSDCLGFRCSEFIQSIDDLISEFVQSVHDLSNDSLITEVLVRGQRDQSLDHRGHSVLGIEFPFDLFQRVLELLDLHHRGIGQS
jgi:hypothetical protein